ncbi:hypothetical protein VTN49DRAFT_7854 [Thermomyces lanuginosus]|uniref:uncharacterized protein n=1 Tax=Thermomyces lanuginosus TaxID=5541 RepID=UPI00374498CE
MRISAILRSAKSTTDWLSPLKASTLKSIAQATGLKCSGTKQVLLGRIRQNLSNAPSFLDKVKEKGNDDKASGSGKRVSVLSVDLGIRNLAFSHLIVSGTTDGELKKPEGIGVKLNAWRRISLAKSASGSASASEEDETYSPSVYAEKAYALLTELLSTYKPDYILLERQRFRSAGSAAVQEWTLRVGMLEAMLYATLHTMQRSAAVPLARYVVVQGIDPGRVAAYWTADGPEGGSEESRVRSKGRQRKKSAREGKQRKIGIVAQWLLASDPSRWERLETNTIITEKRPPVGGEGLSLFVPQQREDPEVANLAHAFIEKHMGVRGPRAREGSVIGKMDDLADCLLQGITWIEWQIRKEKIAREQHFP